MSNDDPEPEATTRNGDLKDNDSDLDMTRPDGVSGPDWSSLLAAARLDDDNAWTLAIDRAEVHRDLERHTAALLDSVRARGE